MKTKYNKIIEWIIIVILFVPALVLLALKYVLKVVAKLVKAMQVVVEISTKYVQALYKELVEVLSVED